MLHIGQVVPPHGLAKDMMESTPVVQVVMNATLHLAQEVLAAPREEQEGSGGAGLEHFLQSILMPVIAGLGIIGNLLNLAVLSGRCRKKEVDFLERGALLSLIGLAVSDLCFCIGLLPKAFLTDQSPVFTERSFRLYYQMYSLYFHEVFIKISTWLTVVISATRYVAICHPLRTRILVRLTTTRVAMLVIYLVWPVLLIPYVWQYSLQEYEVSTNTTLYILDLGAFPSNYHLKQGFTYIWAIIGYFIPVAVLSISNILLIRALRASKRFRASNTHASPRSRRQDVSVRITVTLIAVVTMFLILVSPSVILNFVLRVAPETYDAYYKYAIIFTNVLQAINFSFHFVLYCLINVTLRRTLMALVYACLQRLSAVPTESPPYEPTRSGSSASFNSKNVVSNKLYDTTVV